MKNIEIKNRFTGEIIISGRYESIKDALEKNNSASLDGAKLDGAELNGAELNNASLDGAKLNGAKLNGASLDGAKLDGAKLNDAKLNNASLDGASLNDAELWGAQLSRVSWTQKYIFIKGTRHDFEYFQGEIKIGCFIKTILEWERDYEDIGKANKYTGEQIIEYKVYIDMCKFLENAIGEIKDENG